MRATGAPARAELARVRWRKSTRSANGQGGCVEAGALVDGSGRVAVRDTRDRTGPVLVYPRAAWRAFLGHIHDGTLDPRS